MKLQDGGPIGPGDERTSGSKQNSSRKVKLSPLPAEWMDPLSWRLPSGKALAEFALQSGFLAPLLMGGPLGNMRVKPVKPGARRASPEVPAETGRFRETGRPAGQRA